MRKLIIFDSSCKKIREQGTFNFLKSVSLFVVNDCLKKFYNADIGVFRQALLTYLFISLFNSFTHLLILSFDSSGCDSSSINKPINLPSLTDFEALNV